MFFHLVKAWYKMNMITECCSGVVALKARVTGARCCGPQSKHQRSQRKDPDDRASVQQAPAGKTLADVNGTHAIGSDRDPSGMSLKFVEVEEGDIPEGEFPESWRGLRVRHRG